MLRLGAVLALLLSASSAQAAIVNGGFEIGDAAFGWTEDPAIPLFPGTLSAVTSRAVTEVSPVAALPAAGNQFLVYAQLIANPVATREGTRTLYQDFVGSASHVLSLKAYLHLSANVPDSGFSTAAARIELQDPSGIEAPVAIFDHSITSRDGVVYDDIAPWSSVSYVLPESRAYRLAIVLFDRTDPGTTAWSYIGLDNIKLVPEPSGLVLSAIPAVGVACIVLRRRRNALSRHVRRMLVIAAVLTIASTAHAAQYFLGDLAGDIFGSSYAAGINRLGQVVGSAQTQYVDPVHGYKVDHAFLWTGTQGMSDLGTLAGPTHNSQATGINDLGAVVGSSDTATQPHPFLWTLAGGMQDLGSLSVANDYGRALAINNAGQIVGESNGRAFLYENGTMFDLNSLIPGNLGWILSTASGINDAGWIVGSGSIGVQSHAFLYRGGTITDLGTLGGTYSVAHSINNLGQVVGVSELPNPFPPNIPVIPQVHAFLWTEAGGMQDLLPGTAQYTSAYSINDAGQVAGGIQEFSGDDTPIAVKFANGSFQYAFSTQYSMGTGINANGVLVGNYAGQAFITPEPSTLAMAGMALAGLAVVAIRRRRVGLRGTRLHDAQLR